MKSPSNAPSSAVRTAHRLLIVSRGDESYGVMTELLGFARGFQARGWAVTMLTLGDGGFAAAVAAMPGIEQVADPDRPARYDPYRYGRVGGYVRVLRSIGGMVGRLRRLLAARRFDAMIFCEHGLVLPFAAAVRGRVRAFWLMPNIVGGSTTYPGDLNRRLYAAAFSLSGMVPVANSAFTRKTLGRAGLRSEVVELGVDPAPLLATSARDPIAPLVPADAVRLLMMGRLEPEKGQLQLLRAVLALPELASVHLVLCGGPVGSPYETELRRAAQDAGAAHRVHLVGPVDDAPAWFHAADLVASVRIDPEPFGLTVVEAMLAGRPVLAHALGGPADTVRDGETGWLLPDMEPATIAAGLVRAMADRPRWAEMGAAGRARAEVHYTLEAATDRLASLFARHGIAP